MEWLHRTKTTDNDNRSHQYSINTNRYNDIQSAQGDAPATP
jgi:hypothetical protein